MPEMRFTVQWPDGEKESCYSPSLVIKDYFTPGMTYPIDEFLRRSQIALLSASDRVREKYGMNCSRALEQLARIEAAASQWRAKSTSQVSILSFEE